MISREQAPKAGAHQQTIAAPLAEPRLNGRWLSIARASWIILALVVVTILITSLPGYYDNLTSGFSHVTGGNRATSAAVFSFLSAIASLASSLLSLGLSALLFRRRFQEPAAAALSFYLLIYAVVMSGPLEVWGVYWLENTTIALAAQTILLALPTVALFLLFPNGRFVPAWTRWILLLGIPWSISLLFMLVYNPEVINNLGPLQITLLFLWYTSFLAIGLYAQIFRYRKVSSPNERQQAKWVMFGFTLWIAYILISSIPYFYLTGLPPGSPEPWWAPAASFGWFLALNIIPVSLMIALTRYQLWDIDLVINRTLLVGALTVTIIALYALIVGAAAMLFQTQSNWLIALAATGLVAVLFNPLRQRLQRWVNRLVYGQRDEPLEVLTRLGQQLEGTISPELITPTIVETVARTLRLPYAEIAVVEGEALKTADSYGKPTSDLVTYPLAHQGELVGQLRVARRAPNEEFTRADERLLQSIAHQAGTAVHAAQLTIALQHSRRDLVTTREEERRRLRRDLHDGLGPQLASQTLGLDAALKLIDNDPQAAKELLRALRSQNQSGVQDVRRLVYDLRPPALDDLGLVGALHESVRHYKQQGLNVTFEVPGEFPELPAAVEVAAYRIIQEALTNVVRHAQATSCRVLLAPNSSRLDIEVTDNGCGLPSNYKPGIGLLSMQERTAELNGRFHIESQPPNGTQISVQLPL